MGQVGPVGALVASPGQHAPLAGRRHGIMTQIGAHETEPARAGIINDVGPVVNRTCLPVPFIDQAGSEATIKKPSSLQDWPIGPKNAAVTRNVPASLRRRWVFLMGLSSLEWLGARVTRQTGVAGREQGKKVVGGGAVWQPVVVAQGPPHDGEERCWGVRTEA